VAVTRDNYLYEHVTLSQQRMTLDELKHQPLYTYARDAGLKEAGEEDAIKERAETELERQSRLRAAAETTKLPLRLVASMRKQIRRKKPTESLVTKELSRRQNSIFADINDT